MHPSIVEPRRFHKKETPTPGDSGQKERPSWMICGTNKCEGCDVWQLSHVPSECSTADWARRKGLDRDKDKGDLRRCPEGFHGSDDSNFQERFIHFPQWWPAADVYLRKCRRCVLEDVLAGRLKLPPLTKIYC